MTSIIQVAPLGINATDQCVDLRRHQVIRRHGDTAARVAGCPRATVTSKGRSAVVMLASVRTHRELDHLDGLPRDTTLQRMVLEGRASTWCGSTRSPPRSQGPCGARDAQGISSGEGTEAKGAFAVAVEGSTKAVVTALFANLGIAVAKLVAWVITGSSSMLAEAVHSVADSSNQGLLLLGGKRARRAATPEHPFGYGRDRYIYAFIVSIVLFSLGGCFALYEGYHKLSEPGELVSPLIAVGVLLVAVAFESYALRTAVQESNRIRGDASWVEFVRHAKSPELPVILLEDVGALTGLIFALLGVGVSALTGDPFWDALGTVAIGVLLVTIAIVLAIETKSLLLGEAASRRDVDRIEAALLAEPMVDRIIHLRTMHLGPDELLVAAKIAVAGDDSALDVTQGINAAEGRIRAVVPIARVIYLEPDLYSPDTAAREG